MPREWLRCDGKNSISVKSRWWRSHCSARLTCESPRSLVTCFSFPCLVSLTKSGPCHLIPPSLAFHVCTVETVGGVRPPPSARFSHQCSGAWRSKLPMPGLREEMRDFRYKLGLQVHFYTLPECASPFSLSLIRDVRAAASLGPCPTTSCHGCALKHNCV